MSVATLRRSAIKARRVKQSPAWKRPSDWLTLPVVNIGEQKLVGLHAVYNHDSNWISFTCRGAYTVDWGDGSAPQNYADNAQASHQYNWADVPAATLTSDGFRQVIVTITPQGAGNLTLLNLSTPRHPSSGTANVYSTGWLDMKVVGSVINSLQVSSTGPQMTHRMLRQFEFVGTNVVTSYASCFTNCTALVNLLGAGLVGPSCQSLANTFAGCHSLKYITPGWNTTALTGMNGCFTNCYSLESVPLFDTSLVTTFSTCFQSCVALKSVPLFDTGACAIFSSMFQGCSSLVSVPLFDLHTGTNFTSMFRDCISLITVPLFDTSAGVTFTNMFNGCTALQMVPLLNVANGTTFTTMFNLCLSLTVGALSGGRFSIAYNLCRLSAAELNRIYTNLGVASGAQTITVTSNPGVAGDDPTIATAKGWTVTGS